jgi:CDP-glucose 4,6-dehydratase
MQNGKFGNFMNFSNIYHGKNILITGNTGFKGSWLAQWLTNLGANVIGYSLKPKTTPNHFELLELDHKTYYNDINDLETLKKVINEHNPELIFHLAAQPLVRYSYNNPIETYQTNVIGTLNVLEAARVNNAVNAIVIVTTDKCYENKEQIKGYVESDKMGGYDPYSSSKGCAELLVNSYRNSFFNLNKFNIDHNTLLATARAGNVIGGGDWSEDRLIPDIIRSVINNKNSEIRNPLSTRPWQHVLEPLSGYLELGAKLLNGDKKFAEGWNFGPQENECLTVREVLNKAIKSWNRIQFKEKVDINDLHEANLLSLNIEKAKLILEWSPKWSNDLAIERTIMWYREYYEDQQVNTMKDISLFINS